MLRILYMNHFRYVVVHMSNQNSKVQNHIQVIDYILLWVSKRNKCDTLHLFDIFASRILTITILHPDIKLRLT